MAHASLAEMERILRCGRVVRSVERVLQVTLAVLGTPLVSSLRWRLALTDEKTT